MNSTILQVGPVDALVIRKPIKNLHLSVLPPNGRVRVTAPLHVKDDIIRMFLTAKLVWIEERKRQTTREYVSGETHYFLGEPYRLEVVHVNCPPRVRLEGKDKIVLQVRPDSTFAKREAALAGWYRVELKKITIELLEKWQKMIGVQAKTTGIKRMKTRWGTCNHKAGRIWLNLELAKKPVPTIEYIVVHELLHLIEKKHDRKFKDLLTGHLPGWRGIRAELKRFTLSQF